MRTKIVTLQVFVLFLLSSTRVQATTSFNSYLSFAPKNQNKNNHRSSSSSSLKRFSKHHRYHQEVSKNEKGGGRIDIDDALSSLSSSPPPLVVLMIRGGGGGGSVSNTFSSFFNYVSKSNTRCWISLLLAVICDTTSTALLKIGRDKSSLFTILAAYGGFFLRLVFL